ncbi:glycoside hydrolase family 16 protein [Facilibium subflavum]|uniref:glycoside hydrolase family 16 protein n=1 Tax=Facilibium subflavum TaxID=2219058 RepID=UPI000E65EA06|nr:glycoside hydrolase family 16 protein [Facilibium subflavum]
MMKILLLLLTLIISAQVFAQADRDLYIYNDSQDTLVITPGKTKHMTEAPSKAITLAPGQNGVYKIHDDGFRDGAQIADFQVSDTASGTKNTLSFEHKLSASGWITTIDYDGTLSVNASCGSSGKNCLAPNSQKDASNHNATVHFHSYFSKTPVFEENFSGNQVNEQNWNYRDLGKRNHCINTKDAVSVNNGYLTITTYSKKLSNGKVANYCGMISTGTSKSGRGFLYKYGYWEASIRFHYTPHVQLAFWIQSPTMGVNPHDPEGSGLEMDVFEHTAGAKKNHYDQAFHWNGYGKYKKSWGSDHSNSSLDNSKFHLVAISWTPCGYTMYVDGHKTSRSPGSVPVSHAPEYIILSTEVPFSYPSGGFGPLGKSHATFSVNYVRVYPYTGPSKCTLT